MSIAALQAALAAKKGKTSESQGDAPNPQTSESDARGPAGADTRPDDDKGGTESVEGAAPKGKGIPAGIKFGNPFAKRGAGTQPAGAGPAIRPAGANAPRVDAKPAESNGGGGLPSGGDGRADSPEPAKQSAVGSASGGLAALASLDVSNIGALANDSVTAPDLSAFADETPIEKPVRDIAVTNMILESVVTPEEGEAALVKARANIESFIGMMDSIYDVMNDPDLVSSVITNIMVELQSQPQYKMLIRPQDALSWVRAMRRSRGLAVIKKGEAKEKRTTTKAKKIANEAEMDEMMAGLGIKF